VVRSSAVGRSARIGDGAVLDGVVIGDRARIASGNELAHGLRVWPEAEIGPAAIRFSADA
jgi:mannose-1-phosphate guanylyltransferase